MVLRIHVNLAKNMNLTQVANNMVSKNQKRRSTLPSLYKVQTGNRVYTSMFVLVKWNVNAWDEYYLSDLYFPTIHFP